MEKDTYFEAVLCKALKKETPMEKAYELEFV